MFEPRQQIKSAVVGTFDALGPVALAPFAGIDVRAICSSLWQGKGTIAIATIASFVATLLFVLVVPHQYIAVTQILIDPTNLRGVDNELTPTNQVSDAATLQVESQVHVLSSDNVLRRVIGTEGLDRDPEFDGAQSALRAFANGLLAKLGLDNAPKSADHTLAALNELQRKVRVKRAERTYVVDVSVTSADRDKAVRIANAIAQA